MHGLIYFVFLIITFVFITLYIIVNTKLLKLFLFGSDIFVRRHNKFRNKLHNIINSTLHISTYDEALTLLLLRLPKVILVPSEHF